LLERAAQVRREGEQIGLLRRADIDDGGTLGDGLANASGEIALRADLLSLPRLEDRDGKHGTVGSEPRDHRVARAGDDRMNERPVLEAAARFQLQARHGGRIGRPVEDGDAHAGIALGNRPKSLEARQALG
jgi:hypothetical protein